MKRKEAKVKTDLLMLIENNKEKYLAQTANLKNRMNDYLADKSEEKLRLLVEFVESYEMNETFHVVSDVYKLKKIIKILQLEVESQEIPFSTDVSNCEELLNKYLTTTLLIRRIEVGMEEKLIEQTIEYLNRNSISDIAIQNILEKEIFAQKEQVYKYIKSRRGILSYE